MPEVIKTFRGHAKSLAKQYYRPAVVFWMQAFWYFVRYGASPNDYIRYELYLKNGRGVNEYITAMRNQKLIPALNQEKTGELKDDKYETCRRFQAYIARDWLKVDKTTDPDEVIRFIESHPTVVVKPLSLSGGKGIEKIYVGDIPDVGVFVGKLMEGEWLVEEAIEQHEAMNVFNPYSVNTLRIYTLCDRHGGITVVDAFVRMATREIAVDNFHSGGCAAAVDLETGIVVSPAGDYERNYYIISPVTQEVIVGKRIPSWEQAKDMCVKIAGELFKDDKRYIAFDIAILRNGQPELVEINWYGDPVIRQLNGCRPSGKYQEIKKFL